MQLSSVVTPAWIIHLDFFCIGKKLLQILISLCLNNAETLIKISSGSIPGPLPASRMCFSPYFSLSLSEDLLHFLPQSPKGRSRYGPLFTTTSSPAGPLYPFFYSKENYVEEESSLSVSKLGLSSWQGSSRAVWFVPRAVWGHLQLENS